jgi:hypothetical protein
MCNARSGIGDLRSSVHSCLRYAQCSSKLRHPSLEVSLNRRLRDSENVGDLAHGPVRGVDEPNHDSLTLGQHCEGTGQAWLNPRFTGNDCRWQRDLMSSMHSSAQISTYAIEESNGIVHGRYACPVLPPIRHGFSCSFASHITAKGRYQGTTQSCVVRLDKRRELLSLRVMLEHAGILPSPYPYKTIRHGFV